MEKTKEILKNIGDCVAYIGGKLLSLLRLSYKSALIVVYVAMSCAVIVLTSCQSAMPTRVPPLAEKLGYEYPIQYKGFTFVGVNEAVYNLELKKVEILRTMTDIVNKPAIEAYDTAVNWLNAGLGASLFGGLPLALRKVPKNAVKKEDHEKEVERVGKMHPDDFEATKQS